MTPVCCVKDCGLYVNGNGNLQNICMLQKNHVRVTSLINHQCYMNQVCSRSQVIWSVLASGQHLRVRMGRQDGTMMEIVDYGGHGTAAEAG